MELQEIKDQLDRIESLTLMTKTVLTFEEACKYTGLSRSAMYKMTSCNEVPFFKPRAKLIYFERVELEKWLLQNKCEAIL